MALERLSEIIKDGLAARATRLNDQASNLLKEGNVDGAMTAMDEAREALVGVKKINEQTNSYLATLADIGIEQPPIDYLTRGNEPLPASPTPKPITETAEFKVKPVKNTSAPQSFEHLTGIELPIADREGSRTRKDLFYREEQVAYAAFTLNSDRTGFVANSDVEIVVLAYMDLLGDVSDREVTLQAAKGYMGNYEKIVDRICEKLQIAEEQPSNVLPVMKRFLGWLTAEKEYEDLSMEDLIRVMKRQIPFEKLSSLSQEGEISAIPVKPETPAATVFEAPRKPKKEKGKPRDLAEGEVKIANLLLALNEERNNFQYRNRQEVVKAIHAESLSKITDEQQRTRKAVSYAGQIYASAQNIADKLAYALTNSDWSRERTKDLWTWINEQPEYAGQSIDIIREVLMRKITFQGLLDPNSEPTKRTRRVPVSTENPDAQAAPKQEELVPVNPELSEADVYLIAKRLQEVDDETLSAFGINLPEEDKAELISLVEKHSASTPEDQQETREMLLRKLYAFTKDKQVTFMANIDNEDAQYLLTLLSSVDNEEKVRTLIGIEK